MASELTPIITNADYVELKFAAGIDLGDRDCIIVQLSKHQAPRKQLALQIDDLLEAAGDALAQAEDKTVQAMCDVVVKDETLAGDYQDQAATIEFVKDEVARVRMEAGKLFDPLFEYDD